MMRWVAHGLGTALLCTGPAPAADRDRVVDLGEPVRAVEYGNSQGTVGPSPEGGYPIFYISHYSTSGAELLGFFRCEPETGRLEDLGRILRNSGQCDSMAVSRDGRRLWMGYYTHAHLSVYDPTRPTRIGTEPEANPRDFGPLGGGQYRTQALVEGPDGRVYCGTVPAYGSAPTGALTIFDPKTLNKKVRTDLVPGGAVACLAADEKWVYGSGGGKLFSLDPATQQKARERELACTDLLVAADGTLLVATPRDVQGLDLRTLEARWSMPFAQVEKLQGLHRLAAGPRGELYGSSDLGIFRIEPSEKRLVRLTQSASDDLAIDSDGRLYFAAGASLRRYDPRGAE